VSVQQKFEPMRDAVPRARRFVLSEVQDLPLEKQEVIAVMVSELASNAVVHAGTDFYVTVNRAPNSVRVEVRDLGPGFPEPNVPPPTDELHGRGLFIIKALADEWGITDSFAGKQVWFEMRIQRPDESAVQH
jgi:anti-sigma regulatory factor (Ser/Thr protein kinase)